MKRLAFALVIVLLLALAVGAVACGGPAEEPTPTPTPTPTPGKTPTPTPTPGPTVTMATYTADDYAIDYPEDWEESAEIAERWGSFVAIADPAAENVYITVGMTMLPGLYDVWTIFDYARETTIPPDYPDYAGLDEGIDATVDDLDAILHTYTYTDDGTAMKLKQVYVIDGLNAWGAKCYAPEADWSEYQDIFDQILGSFTLSP